MAQDDPAERQKPDRVQAVELVFVDIQVEYALGAAHDGQARDELENSRLVGQWIWSRTGLVSVSGPGFSDRSRSLHSGHNFS